MNYPLKIHQPPHVFVDNAIYFISVHTYEDQPLFTDERKKELLQIINKYFNNFSLGIFAYAIVDNHYHLLFKVKVAKDISEAFKMIHGSLSHKWNKDDNLEGRTIFQNYWDYCIGDDKDFWTHFNYIHINPVKHGLVKDFEELKSYKFCSYFKWFEKNGEKWMSECFENNPVSDYIAPGDLIKI